MINISDFKKNISLIGFMGCGKSTVGIHLANLINIECIDTDYEIEKDTGMRISQIFEVYGENHFRILEKEKIRLLTENKNKNKIITTGGGAILDAENVAMLKKNGIIIYLRVTPLQIFHNLKDDNTRPLLNGSEKEQKIIELMEQREPLYEAVSDFIINTSEKDIDSILDDIKKILGEINE